MNGLTVAFNGNGCCFHDEMLLPASQSSPELRLPRRWLRFVWTATTRTADNHLPASSANHAVVTSLETSSLPRVAEIESWRVQSGGRASIHRREATKRAQDPALSNCFQLETIGPVGLDLHHDEERWSGRIVEICHATFERGEHQSVFSSKMEKISVSPMTTFTSKTASVGFEGIVNLLLGDRATGCGYER